MPYRICGLPKPPSASELIVILKITSKIRSKKYVKSSRNRPRNNQLSRICS